MAEFNDIYGAKIICLDDINAFKCHAVRQLLLNDPAYELLAEDQRLRNGFSIFYRVDAACNLRAIKAVLGAMQLRVGTRKPSWRIVRSIRRVLERN